MWCWEAESVSLTASFFKMNFSRAFVCFFVCFCVRSFVCIFVFVFRMLLFFLFFCFCFFCLFCFSFVSISCYGSQCTLRFLFFLKFISTHLFIYTAVWFVNCLLIFCLARAYYYNLSVSQRMNNDHSTESHKIPTIKRKRKKKKKKKHLDNLGLKLTLNKKK